MSLAEKLFVRRQHTCPPWVCFTFDNPLRKLIHDPQKILGPYAKAGNTVLDLGPGKGYFSIPLARMVGPNGRVIAADIKAGMLSALARRARRNGVAAQIRPHLCSAETLGFDDPLDFALMFWMLHETPDPERILREVRNLLRPEGRILIAEPKLHVSESAFESILNSSEKTGFDIQDRPWIRLSRAVLLSGRSC